MKVERVAVTFDVWVDEEKLGTLRVSQGLLKWRHRKDSKSYSLKWAEFDRLMMENRDKTW